MRARTGWRWPALGADFRGATSRKPAPIRTFPFRANASMAVATMTNRRPHEALPPSRPLPDRAGPALRRRRDPRTGDCARGGRTMILLGALLTLSALAVIATLATGCRWLAFVYAHPAYSALFAGVTLVFLDIL